MIARWCDRILTWLFPDPDMESDEMRRWKAFSGGGWR